MLPPRKRSGNMIDLEQAKKRVEEIADHFRAFQCLNRIDSDKLLTINHDLIREVERLEKICPFTDHISLTVHNQYTNNLQCEKAELEAGYNLRGEWLDHIQAYFGVEDHGELPAMVFLTLEKEAALQDKLEAQQKVIDALRKEVERLEKRWGESVDLVSEVEERAQKAERQVCQLRGALELILPHARDYVGKHEVGSNRRYVEIAEQALASTSRCGHKEHDEAYQKVVKAFESGADGILALVNEIIEQRGMKDWLTFNAKHGPNCMPDQFCDCGLKELLK